LKSRALRNTAIGVAAFGLLVVLAILLFDWNWLRGPIERRTYEKTGRQLAINGDLSVKLRWPSPRIRIEGLTFANPAWAREPQMVAADAVEVSFSIPQLFRRNYVLTEVTLDRAVVHLEKAADGRKNWLLDLQQQDETARLRIERLTLQHAQLGYDDAAQKTSIRSELSSQTEGGTNAAAGREPGIVFSASGRYKGEPMKLSGSGGPVLALRDETTPYPLKVAGNFGRTSARIDGTITSLLKFSALDIRLDLRGDSLAQLFPVIGIALPKTAPYATSGHLTHQGDTWLYEKFSGRIGASDIAGTLRFDTAGKRPYMHGELASKVLAIEDLGPLIGARPGTVAQAKAAPVAAAHVLPDQPFNTERWDSVDADVVLRAASIRRAKEVPVDNLHTRIRMKDSVLTLDPLDFGVAGGKLAGTVTLDGRRNPIAARTSVRASKLDLPKLLPTLKLAETSIGRIDGQVELAGTGNTVGQMLGTSNGKAGLVMGSGEVSNLLMEMVGLDLYEIVKFKLKGDRAIKIRCGVADFGVSGGVMQANALVLDTEDTNIRGAGTIDLRTEKVALTLKPEPKDKSPIVLRGPLHMNGSLANAKVTVDSGTVAARGLGALLLGFVNPLLAVVPLIETGPGRDSDCGRLIRQASIPAKPRPPASR
jgi:uncharacterized protein involved in outer membrane biogenesis